MNADQNDPSQRRDSTSMCPVGCGAELEPMARWAPYRVCPLCGTGSFTPIEKEEYWGAGVEPSAAQHAFWGGRTKQWEATVGPGAGRLLDIGCGFGHFVKWANDNGWDAWGYDTDEWAIQRSEAPGRIVSVLTGIAERFDLLTMWDVLEHGPDPIDFAASLKPLLRPGGRILVGCPDFDSLKLRWEYYRLRPDQFTAMVRPHEHYSQFTQLGLRLTLERAGFERVATLRPPPSHRANHLVTLAVTRWPRLRIGQFAEGYMPADRSIGPESASL